MLVKGAPVIEKNTIKIKQTNKQQQQQNPPKTWLLTDNDGKAASRSVSD